MSKNFALMSVAERREYLKEHFLYEVQMLFFALQETVILSQKINEGGKELIGYNNMALEDFLLHARNLLEFFYDNKKPTKTYIQAHHFFGKANPWKNLLPPKTKSIKEVESRINHEITHLGANRYSGNPTDKNWDTVPILHDFMKLVRVFIDNLPEKYYSQELKNC